MDDKSSCKGEGEGHEEIQNSVLDEYESSTMEGHCWGLIVSIVGDYNVELQWAQSSNY
jgi:hypothetical protein